MAAMHGFLLVALGGGLGAALRHGLGLLLAPMSASGGVYAILVANTLGSFLMGITMGWLSGRSAGDSNSLYLLLCVGVFGGFTTFSTFSLQAVHMFTNDQVAKGMAYVGLSVIGALFGLFVGLLIGRKLFL